MAPNDRTKVNEARIAVVEQRVRSMAGERGVQYIWWPGVRACMTENGLSVLDIGEALMGCVVECENSVGGVRRYTASGSDLDGRRLRVQLMISDELCGLEIFELEILGS